jgi:hypothetical protein
VVPFFGDVQAAEVAITTGDIFVWKWRETKKMMKLSKNSLIKQLWNFKSRFFRGLLVLGKLLLHMFTYFYSFTVKIEQFQARFCTKFYQDFLASLLTD